MSAVIAWQLLGSYRQPGSDPANQRSANEFVGLVRLAVPQDPNARHGHLIDTIQQTDVGQFGVQVSIGSDAEPYPAHLEFGHRARDGTHVEAKPFWYPAKRIIAKRARTRMLAAQRAAIKAVAASAVAGG